MMNQKEAVYVAVTTVFGDVEVIPETGKWTDTQKKEVYGMLLASFKRGEWSKNSGGTDDGSLMKYIPGLVNNHVRKDTRLNGGSKYETKRPGSRTGSTDESVKAMRTLLAVTTDPAIRMQIQAAIDARLEELKPKRAINVEALPESLRHLVG